MKIHARDMTRQATLKELARDGKTLTTCGAVLSAALGVVVTAHPDGTQTEEPVTCPQCKRVLAERAITALLPPGPVVHLYVRGMTGRVVTLACGTKADGTEWSYGTWELEQCTCRACLAEVVAR